MDKVKVSWILLIIYMFIIFYLSSLPKIEAIEKTPEFYIKDKMLHFLEYSILGFFSYNAFKNHEFLKDKLFFYVIMFATIYGITDELHQLFTPNRIFSFGDIIADFFGSCFILIKKFL